MDVKNLHTLETLNVAEGGMMSVIACDDALFVLITVYIS